MTATLHDNPSTHDFASMLPLDLTIDDYSTNEKIAYLPRKLTEQGSGPFENERRPAAQAGEIRPPHRASPVTAPHLWRSEMRGTAQRGEANRSG
jgi:hypothetical protein